MKLTSQIPWSTSLMPSLCPPRTVEILIFLRCTHSRRRDEETVAIAQFLDNPIVMALSAHAILSDCQWLQSDCAMHDPVSQRTIHGSCHCGNIRFTLTWPDKELTIQSRACGCGFCTKHGAAWTSNPQGQFSVRVADPTRVAHYRFGTKTADFHVCSTCGVPPIVTCTIEGRRYAVFNVNTFEDVDKSDLAKDVMNFEGETEHDRLARRRRNWTPEAFDDPAQPSG